MRGWRVGVTAGALLALSTLSACTAEDEREFEESMEALAWLFLVLAVIVVAVIALAVGLLASGLSARRRAKRERAAGGGAGTAAPSVAPQRDGTVRIAIGATLLVLFVFPQFEPRVGAIVSIAAGAGAAVFLWRREDQRLAGFDDRQRALLVAAAGLVIAGVVYVLSSGGTGVSVTPG